MCFSVLSLMRMMVFLVCNTELTSNGCLLQFINAIISGFKTVFSFLSFFPLFPRKKSVRKKVLTKFFCRGDWMAKISFCWILFSSETWKKQELMNINFFLGEGGGGVENYWISVHHAFTLQYNTISGRNTRKFLCAASY